MKMQIFDDATYGKTYLFYQEGNFECPVMALKHYEMKGFVDQFNKDLEETRKYNEEESKKG